MIILLIFIIVPAIVLGYASWFNRNKHDSTLDDEWDGMFLTPFPVKDESEGIPKELFEQAFPTIQDEQIKGKVIITNIPE